MSLEFVKHNSYEHIHEEYLTKNVPFLLDASWTKEWKAVKDFVLPNGDLNFGFLKEQFGKSPVMVKNQ